MSTRFDVNCWLTHDDRAFAGAGKLRHHITIAKEEYGRGIDVFFPEGVPLDTIQSIADAINAALAPAAAKTEEPADVS
jgi:hypothetical protein